MKSLPVCFILIVAGISLTIGKNLGFRRVRSDGLGPVSTPTLEEARTAVEHTDPTGCSKGRYLNSDIPSGRDYAAPPGQINGNAIRPMQFGTKDYTIFDNFRQRTMQFFDPEEWVCCNPRLPFPSELDIPPGWAIYNPVTVQAPQPTIIRDLQKYKYTGYYYACPSFVSPYENSWYFNPYPVNNPCKWIWYQSYKDAGVREITDVQSAVLNKPEITKQNH